MTTEKFEQAREIKQNIDEAMDVVTLLGSFEVLKSTLEIRLKSNNTLYYKVDTIPADLLNTLIQDCREYIEKQQNEFKNL